MGFLGELLQVSVEVNEAKEGRDSVRVAGERGRPTDSTSIAIDSGVPDQLSVSPHDRRFCSIDLLLALSFHIQVLLSNSI